MSIIAISSQILRRRASIFCIRNVKHQRPNSKFGSSPGLTANHKSYHRVSYEEYNQPIDTIGYFLLGIPIITFILGSWQVDRRRWKVELIDEMKKKTSMPPMPFPENLEELEQMEYCPVKVRGEFLYDAEFAIGPKSLIKNGAGASEKSGGIFSSRNNTGFNLITPFKLADRDTTILVNRGWIPSKISRLPKEKLGHVPGTVEITGIVRLQESRPPLSPKNTPSAGVFIYRDIKSMAFLAGTDPVFLDLVDSCGVPGGPIAGQTRISFRNEHLTYVITWYTLSILTAFMWHRLYIRKLPLV